MKQIIIVILVFMTVLSLVMGARSLDSSKNKIVEEIQKIKLDVLQNAKPMDQKPLDTASTSRRNLLTRSASKSIRGSKAAEPLIDDFSPEVDYTFSRYFDYQPASLLIRITQNPGELEMQNLGIEFSGGIFDLNLFNEGDVLGQGNVLRDDGFLSYDLVVAFKTDDQYFLNYKVTDSSLSQYTIGLEEMFGTLTSSEHGVGLFTVRMFEEYDQDNLANTQVHVLFFNEGLYRFDEYGEFALHTYYVSEMDNQGVPRYTEDWRNIQVEKYTTSYCSMMQGMYVIAMNSELGDANFDARLDLNQDENIDNADWAIFGTYKKDNYNYDVEDWCAYQITPI